MATAINKQQKPPSKPEKVDLSGDGWRDEPIGFKKGKNEGKSYREVDEETLIWIINDCKVETWKQKAVEEMKLRENKPQEAATEEADELFA